MLSSLNAVISTNESTRFITGHVIYNLAYAYKFQQKTTVVRFKTFSVLHVQTYLGLSFYSFAIYCALGAILFLSTVGKGALQKYLIWNYIRDLKHIVKAENIGQKLLKIAL